MLLNKNLICIYPHLFSTWNEFDPNTVHVFCISICIGVSLYFIHMPLVSLCGIHISLFPYMVIQPIVLGMALLWTAMDSSLYQGPLLWRHNDMTVIVSRNTRGHERDTQQRPDNANARRLQTVNREIFVGFNAISNTYLRNIKHSPCVIR